jgi:hypothetical protein
MVESVHVVRRLADGYQLNWLSKSYKLSKSLQSVTLFILITEGVELVGCKENDLH